MAIKYDAFVYSNTDKKANGLKANETFTKFFYHFKINNKQLRKVFDYSELTLNKSNRLKKVNEELENPFNQSIKLDFTAGEYFNKKCVASQWTDVRKRQYELYIY